MSKRFTETRNGENVIPLRNAICGIGMPHWCLTKANDNEMFLNGDAADRLAELEQNAMTKKELQRILWGIIGREGIVITNQNIDWLLERVYKEKGGSDK